MNEFGIGAQDVRCCTDRGVLGHKIPRMEFKDLSENGLISSQGTPERTSRVARSARGLRMRRKRLKTGNSSIQLFFSVALVLCAIGVGTKGVRANDGPPTMQSVGDSFEAMMLSHLYTQLRQTSRLLNVGDDNPFAPSRAEMIYRSMSEDEMLKSLAKRQPLGFGNLVVRQLQRQVGVGQSAIPGVQRKNVGSAQRNLLGSTKENGG